MMLPIIDIVLDGKRFAARNSWSVIPRVGEIILLNNGTTWAKITQVVWGDDSAAACGGLERQWIQILCKTINPEEAV